LEEFAIVQQVMHEIAPIAEAEMPPAPKG
jgi:hypothetical protein